MKSVVTYYSSIFGFLVFDETMTKSIQGDWNFERVYRLGNAPELKAVTVTIVSFSFDGNRHRLLDNEVQTHPPRAWEE